MEDVFFTLILMLVFKFTMQKNGTWMPIHGIRDGLGWVVLCFIILAFSKLPFLIVMEGYKIPFTSNPLHHAVASIVAISVWFVLMYWRLPSKLVRIFIRLLRH